MSVCSKPGEKNLAMTTNPPAKPPSREPSPKLVQMLNVATPEQRDQEAKIVAKLLAKRAIRP